MGFTVLSSRTTADRAEGRDGFDCGFLVPDHLNPLIRDERHRRYWSGLLLPGVLVLSVHVIFAAAEDGDSHLARIRFETQEFYEEACARYPNGQLKVLVGVGANVSLPAAYRGLTGFSVLDPLPSHSITMQHDVLSWFEQLGVRALNTFNDGMSPLGFWTCGWKRPLAKRSQIDFIAVSSTVRGNAHPVHDATLQDHYYLRRGADHRPIISHVELEMHTERVCCKPLSLKGWVAHKDDVSEPVQSMMPSLRLPC